MKIKITLFSVLLFLTVNVSFAQWDPDVKLTNDSANSFTSYNNGWCVAANGSVVHVVWYKESNGNSEIYYKRSTNGGTLWTADKRLTNNADSSYLPSIAVSGSLVHIVWQDNRDGNQEIYYIRSTDDGVNWGPETRLTNNTAFSGSPIIAVSDSLVHVAWYDKRNVYLEIFYKRSTDGGKNWEADTRLTNNTASKFEPSIAVFGSVVHIVWYEYRGSSYEIIYKRSTDAGINWGVDTRLTNNFGDSYRPSIAVSDMLVNVVWSDTRDGNPEIYFKRSTDGGVNWGADTRLTNEAAGSWGSSIAVSGLIVHIVWYDYRVGSGEIYYKRSTDGGINWGGDIQLTNNTSYSERPYVAVSGTFVHLVWTDKRNGYYEIYYKRNPTGNVGIQNISTEIPLAYSLGQNYPNPFNPVTKIRFQVAGNSNVLIKVYDINGKEVRTLVNERLKAGTYEVIFDGSQLTSGVYFYKLTTESFLETKRMLLIK